MKFRQNRICHVTEFYLVYIFTIMGVVLVCLLPVKNELSSKIRYKGIKKLIINKINRNCMKCMVFVCSVWIFALKSRKHLKATHRARDKISVNLKTK
ncbi:MAG: hypothetical protein LBH37_01865 [Oscillospiraceae bacterium]|nr:hypothetical protein [Oscillospiraceae bacterium]